MLWYTDRRFVRALPLAYRLLAFFCRVTPNWKQAHLLVVLRAFHGIVWLRRALGRSCEAIVPVGDLRVALDLSDVRAGLVYKELTGSVPEAQVLQRLLRPGDTFLDIGANHGSYSLLAARIVGPAGSVLAFECQPRLTRLIAKSFAANQFTHARVIEVALSDAPRRARLHVPAWNSGAASLLRSYVGDNPHTCVDVECARLDDLPLPAPGPAGNVVVKMDIEGGERQCLEGAKKFFAQTQPSIILEINAEACQAGGYTVADLLAQLRSYGYTRFGELERFIASGETSTALDDGCNRNIVAVGTRACSANAIA